MTSQNIPAALALALNDLPALPQSLTELLDACNSPDVNIHDIGAMVARDVVISARILQLANSAFLGARSGFAQIEHAVVYLGLDTVRNLAISVSVHEAFRGDGHHGVINLPEFWYHSLFTAVFAKKLAEQGNYRSPAEAYLCGLLHDLGKLLLAASFPDQYRQLMATLEPGQSQADKEQEQFAIDHAAASALLVHHWRLPEEVATAIEHHHRAPVETSPLAGIIYQANRASTAFADGGEHHTDESLAGSLEIAHATVEAIALGLGIAVHPASTPANPPAPSTPPSDTLALQQKIEEITILHGALDNLLRANDRNRICRVIEETLVLLAGLDRTLLFLPNGSEKLEPVTSSANPLLPAFTHLEWPASDDGSTIISRCRHQGTAMRISCSEQEMGEQDRRLADWMACDHLLALPVAVGSQERAVMLIGIHTNQLARTREIEDSLRFLADHLGARLQQEQASRRRSAELIRREMAGIDKVCRNIAHEITSPLAVMHNYLAVMGKKHSNGDGLARDLQLIGSEIDRIGAIVRQLENISDTSSRPDPVTVRFDQVLRDTLGYFRTSLLDPNAIEAQVKLEPNTRPVKVETELLRQLLTILFTNAAEALGQGGRIEISSRLNPADESGFLQQLVIDFCDNGPGVRQDLAASVFNAGVTSKASGHLGLGLSIARRLLQDRNGSISYRARAGGGACFQLQLPIA